MLLILSCCLSITISSCSCCRFFSAFSLPRSSLRSLLLVEVFFLLNLIAREIWKFKGKGEINGTDIFRGDFLAYHSIVIRVILSVETIFFKQGSLNWLSRVIIDSLFEIRRVVSRRFLWENRLTGSGVRVVIIIVHVIGKILKLCFFR